MKISLIIPFYKKLDVLERILKNINEHQTIKPDEIIIVDDDSGVDLSVLNEKYQFIVIKNNISEDGQHRAGQARNKGYSQATGDVIIFQDNDVILGRHYIETVKQYFEQDSNRNNILIGNYLDIDSQLQSLNDSILFDYLNDNEAYLLNILDSTPSATLIQWIPEATESRQFAIRKECFKDVGCFNENFVGWGCEDTEFFYRAFKDKGKKIFCNRRLYAFHLEHPVDMVKLMDSMKINAEYFISIYPEVKIRMSHLFNGFDVFGRNKRLRATYNKVKEIREKTGNPNFGLLPCMRAKGLWVY